MHTKTTDPQRLRGAVIGYGFISGKGHIPAYLEREKTTGDVEIIAVADISESRRQQAAKALPNARIYSDYATLLNAEAQNLDFVDISVPPAEHAKIAHAAFSHGLHVLCEKPLTTTLEDAAALLATAQRTRRVLFPCHNYKHAPVVKAVQRVIQSGRIGKVRSLTMNTFRNTHAKGVTDWNTHWRRQSKHSGGGIAMDHGSHTFYLTFDWMGSYPTAVTAKMSNLEPTRWDTEDNFSAVLTFPNGVVHTQLSWTAGVRKVIYTVHGDKGAITVEDDAMQVAVIRPTDGPDEGKGAVEWDVERFDVSSDWMDASHVSWFNSLFDQFREAIAKEDFVGKEAKEAYMCIQIITEAYRSAADGCREKMLHRKLGGFDLFTQVPGRTISGEWRQ